MPAPLSARRPQYQDAAVRAFLAELGEANAGLFNASGRAFPDVAAMGENVVIVFEGEEASVAGTSCSSPIFASTIALLNDELISVGRRPLGFLNPFLHVLFAGAGRARG